MADVLELTCVPHRRLPTGHQSAGRRRGGGDPALIDRPRTSCGRGCGGRKRPEAAGRAVRTEACERRLRGAHSPALFLTRSLASLGAQLSAGRASVTLHLPPPLLPRPLAAPRPLGRPAARKTPTEPNPVGRPNASRVGQQSKWPPGRTVSWRRPLAGRKRRPAPE